MSIKEWPNEDKPIEKLLSNGEQMLTDAELIAIFLNTGAPGQSALDLAKAMLTEFCDLKNLLQTPTHQLMKVKGIGKSKSAVLKAATELGRRYLQVKLEKGEVLNNSNKTQAFLFHRLRHRTNEVFACIFMDNRFRLIQFEELFQGSINEATIYPREIVKKALHYNAAKIILAHNHPSGEASPSAADKAITDVIKQALKWIDIEVVDHIIIGHSAHFSFAETRLL